MATIPAQWTQAFSNHQKHVTSQLQGFNDAIDLLAENWQDLITNLVGDMSTSRQQVVARQIHYLSGQLQQQLNQIGFTETAKQFVTGFDDSILFAQTQAAALGSADLMLSPLMENTLANLRQMDLDAFQEIGSRAVRTLARELTMNTIIGTPKAQMIKNLDAVLEGEFAGKARMYAETALRSFDRQSQFAVFQDAGIDRFKYFGPRDLRNRAFCADHVGKTYSVAEIKNMNNGSATFGNVMIYGGGPRCRHAWQPVPDAVDHETEHDYSALD